MSNCSGGRWGCPLRSPNSQQQPADVAGRKEGLRRRLWRENLGLPLCASTPGWSHRREIHNPTSPPCRPCQRAAQLRTEICKYLQYVSISLHVCEKCQGKEGEAYVYVLYICGSVKKATILSCRTTHRFLLVTFLLRPSIKTWSKSIGSQYLVFPKLNLALYSRYFS